MIFRTGAMVALLTGISIVPAAAATGVHCGDTITTNVTLTNDLNCTGVGLYVGDPQDYQAAITLNLGGHVIRGKGTATGVVSGSSKITITDGMITNFAHGVDGDVGQVKLARMKISKTSSWLASKTSSSAIVVDSRFVDAGTGGASVDASLKVNNSEFLRSRIVSGSQSNTYVYNSQFTDGNIAAVWLWAAGNVINSCPAGAAAGFDIGKYNTGVAQVSGNTIHGCDIGIRLVKPEWDSKVVGNTLSGNITGLRYDASGFAKAIEITANVLTRNAGDGLAGTGDTAVNLTANSAHKNGGRGINVTGAHITDGGANTAIGNGGAPACTGVVCQ